MSRLQTEIWCPAWGTASQLLIIYFNDHTCVALDTMHDLYPKDYVLIVNAKRIANKSTQRPQTPPRSNYFPGFESGFPDPDVCRIAPKMYCIGFILLSAWVISPSIVKIGRLLYAYHVWSTSVTAIVISQNDKQNARTADHITLPALAQYRLSALAWKCQCLVAFFFY